MSQYQTVNQIENLSPCQIERQKNLLCIGDIQQKLKSVESSIELAFGPGLNLIPASPARGHGVIVLPPHLHPPKKGYASTQGRGRLLHDLASIELQALELCLRTLYEYKEAPEAFRLELANLARSEATHLTLCLEGLESLNCPWGTWPVHTALWGAVSPQDSLIERLVIVHRYLEGSGLDAQTTLVRRMEGTTDKVALPIMKVILRDEIDHVYFGSYWFKKFISAETESPQKVFQQCLHKLKPQLPRRVEPISHRYRLQAGFSPEELDVVETFRQEWFVST